eukprot:TRINITY_DN17977_c0_g1_i1.p1 TRINITY_DN17977_c0_g1~~TRINITY_DN17977_c0_g1_i1.p1  ORF type:complete len:613 (+),score=81.11 TRINITY_DN17977_c0_g1_i1:109-1947(+)
MAPSFLLACLASLLPFAHSKQGSELLGRSGASVSAIHPAAFGRFANLTARWTNVATPSADQWISLWSPPDYPAPVKLLPTNASASWKDGHGEVTFEVLNVRQPFIFRLTSGAAPGWGYGKVLAESDVIMPENLPMQIHTSVTSVAGEVQIMWVDNSSATPVVKYGEDAAALSKTATGRTTTYTKADFEACNTSDGTALNRFFHPGFIHTVVLQGLAPGQKFYYSVGHADNSRVQDSPVIAHKGALPAAGAPQTRLLYLADMGVGPARDDEVNGALDPEGNYIERENAGQSSGGRLVLESMMRFEGDGLEAYDMLLVNGDLTYSCGESWLNEAWFTIMEPVASRMPMMVSIGNHEWDHSTAGWPPSSLPFAKAEYGEDSGGECGIPYRRRFQMPEGTSSIAAAHAAARKPQEAKPMDFDAWYSFDSGVVHIAVLSIEHDFSNGSTQHKWLDADLAAVNRTKTPWLIVAQHREIFNGGRETTGLHGYQQEHLEPLYLQHKVDLVLTAHVHTYVRMCALKYGKCVKDDEDAPVYIIDGTAGAYTEDAASGEGRNCTQPAGPFPEPILAEDCSWGWGRITADRSALKWEHLRWFDGKVTDDVTLRKASAVDAKLYV